MPATVFYSPRWRAIDANGAPINGALLNFFEAGTSTPLAVYADVDLTTSLGTQVAADTGGLFAELFMLPQPYDITCTTALGVPVWTAVDFYPPNASSSSNINVSAVAGENFVVGDGAYVSDGSNGLNVGQLYKWDADLAYASQTPEAYFATGTILAGASGLFRSAGILDGFSGLVPGALYYISGTAGEVSLTPGHYSRLVGQAQSTTAMFVQTNPPALGAGLDLLQIEALLG